MFQVRTPLFNLLCEEDFRGRGRGVTQGWPHSDKSSNDPAAGTHRNDYSSLKHQHCHLCPAALLQLSPLKDALFHYCFSPLESLSLLPFIPVHMIPIFLNPFSLSSPQMLSISPHLFRKSPTTKNPKPVHFSPSQDTKQPSSKATTADATFLTQSVFFSPKPLCPSPCWLSRGSAFTQDQCLECSPSAINSELVFHRC